MNYYITNGNKYYMENDDGYYGKVELCYATRFKKKAAVDVLTNLVNPNEHWGIRKVGNSKNGKNYVLTTGNNYVCNNLKKMRTTNIQEAKSFKSAADAMCFIKKYAPFDESFIIDSNSMESEYEIRQFTDEQLETIGYFQSNKKCKRIALNKNVRKIVYDKGGGKCALCGRDVSYNDFTVDHILPLSRGGTNNIKNFQIACDTCNRLKNNSTDSEFLKGMSAILSNKIDSQNEEEADEIIYPIIRKYIRNKIKDVNFDKNRLSEVLNYGTN